MTSPSPLNLLATGAFSSTTTTYLINKLSKSPRKYNTHTICLTNPADVPETIFAETKFDAIYLVLPVTPQCTERVKMFLDIAKQNRVPFVIFASVIAAEDLLADLADRYLQVEAHLKAIRMPHTVLRVAPLQQHFMHLSDDFHQPIPTIELPLSNGALAPIHARDVANVAAAILDRPAAHLYKTYTLTGPDLLTGVEIAGRASVGLDRPVRFRNSQHSEARKHLSSVDPSLDADVLSAALCLFNQIAAHGCELITTEVQRLTSKPATPLEDFFHEHRALFNQYAEDGRRQSQPEVARRRGSGLVSAAYMGNEGNGLARFMIRPRVSSKL